MRVFLSYASEDREVAERVAAALRAADHEVFVDHDALRAGDAFHERLRHAIGRADVFVCLLSCHAVAEGSYVRDEIDAAFQRWRAPANRIIPVLLGDVPIDRLPAPVQPLHVLPARQDPVAGILSAVAAARRKRAERRWLRAGTALAAVVAGIGVVLLVRWLTPGSVVVDLALLELESTRVDPWPESFRAHGRIRNGTRGKSVLRGWEIETRPDDVGLLLVSESPTGRIDLEPGTPEPWELELELPAPSEDRAKFEWRACAVTTDGDICTTWRRWDPRRGAAGATPVRLPRELHGRARAVGASQAQLLVAAEAPNQLLWITETGAVARTEPLGGEPVAIFADAGEVLVATRDPDSVEAWSLAGERLWRAPFVPPGREEATSTRIHDMVATPTTVWVATTREQGEPVLAALDRASRAWSIPSFYDDFDIDAENLRMAVSGGRVWAGEENISPASLHVWTDEARKKFGGHDVDLVSCADSVVTGGDGSIVFRSCDGELVEAIDQGDRLRRVRRLGRIAGEDEQTSDPSVWTAALLARSERGFVLGLTKGAVGGGEILEAQIVWKPSGGDARTVLELPEARVVDLAMTSDAVLALLESPQRRGLVLLRLP